MRRSAGLVLALAALALAAPGGAADLRATEAVGAVPLRADVRPTTAPRDAAEQKALAEAVRRVALELLSDQDPAEVEPRLDGVLGTDMRLYVSSFRTLEDRGERPVLFSDDPQATSEYVVVVEARIDAGLVRDRLTRGGLIVAPAGDLQRAQVRLEAEGLADYAAYRVLRETLLVGVGVRSALPLEFEQGRAVFEVEGELTGDALFAALQRAAPPGLGLTALEAGPERLRLRVDLAPEPQPVLDPAGAARPGD